eukprot:TRINITY_DN5711_c0_g1_i1.p1 TRINITY_DN5711_c0_g1~~TRINITY_DN5711_c0_g1_i1.p1  ORF type:complete len:416 (+),score=93.85 TRINITY_DN5711_c0_g1_i1:653-1900(+)
MFTIYVSSSLGAATMAVDVAAQDNVKALKEKVGRALEVDPRDFTMYHEGEELGAPTVPVSATILVEGSTVEARPSDSFEARHELARMGYACTASTLHEVICDDGLTDEDKERIVQLMVAACDEHLETDRCLVEAASMGFLDIVRILWETIKRDYFADPTFTPLHEAASMGHFDIVKMLVSLGCPLDAKDTAGETPLHRGCAEGHIEIIRYLLTQGAALAPSSNEGATPLQHGCTNIAVIKELVSFGYDVTGHDGQTALQYASISGYLEVIEYLYSKGATLDADEYGCSALHYASQNGHIDIISFCLKHGLDINKQSNEGLTPLHYASLVALPEAVRHLISHGADVSIVSNDGKTPLHCAVRYGNRVVIAALVAAGVDLAARDKFGRTALAAAELEHVKDILRSHMRQHDSGIQAM